MGTDAATLAAQAWAVARRPRWTTADLHALRTLVRDFPIGACVSFVSNGVGLWPGDWRRTAAQDPDGLRAGDELETVGYGATRGFPEMLLVRRVRDGAGRTRMLFPTDINAQAFRVTVAESRTALARWTDDGSHVPSHSNRGLPRARRQDAGCEGEFDRFQRNTATGARASYGCRVSATRRDLAVGSRLVPSSASMTRWAPADARLTARACISQGGQRRSTGVHLPPPGPQTDRVALPARHWRPQQQLALLGNSHVETRRKPPQATHQTTDDEQGAQTQVALAGWSQRGNNGHREGAP
jgi:hypothetical protein